MPASRTIEGATAVELSLRALCSNRHLTEHLPVGESGADFRLLDDVTLDVICVAGPTPPREPVVSQLRTRSETAHQGTVAWRLINMLSMNHLGLVERGSGKNAAALREILSMFADLADSMTERKIRGIRSVDSRTVVRRIRERGGIGAGRGIEITVTLDEKAFEGSGAFLLGAILERFFCGILGAQSFHRDRHLHDRARRDHALAAAHGHPEAAVTLLDDMQKEPWRFDFFSVMRRLERDHPHRPRIGDSSARREEYVQLGQDPYMDFPASNSEPGGRERPAPADIRQVSRTARPAGRAAAEHDRGKP